jgi:glycosyltransferase involved in cell wall biosynthesis
VSSVVLVVPGSIETHSGGYEYDRQIASALRARGWNVVIRELAGEFPVPSADARSRAERLLAAIPSGSTVVVDGLAFCALPDEFERETERLRLVALVHMPLAFETGLAPAEARAREERERRALAAARLVVATGTVTADTVARYGVPRDRIATVEPGTNPAPLAAGSGDPSTVHLICVATLGPGKGYDILISALSTISGRNWRLTCVGSLDRHPETVRLLRTAIEASGLTHRISLAGDVDADGLAALYSRSDLFVLATLHETFGMAVAEALARGLPVVSTDTGAIAKLVGDEAGIVVPPGNQDALAHALESAMDPRVRARLAQGSQRVRQRLRTWQDAASATIHALERI